MPTATTLLMLTTLSGVGAVAADHETDGRAPRHQVSLEAVPVAGALGYAFRLLPDTAVGVKLGFGFDLTSTVPLAGGHFTDDWGLSYEARDGATSKRYLEVAQAALFVRHFLPRGFHLEGGVRIAGGMHMDSSDDDAAGAAFTGAYGAVFWGGSILQVGSRVSIGALSEPRGGAPERELAVVVSPIILKLTTP
jgi:hypothetical protein